MKHAMTFKSLCKDATTKDTFTVDPDYKSTNLYRQIQQGDKFEGGVVCWVIYDSVDRLIEVIQAPALR